MMKWERSRHSDEGGVSVNRTTKPGFLLTSEWLSSVFLEFGIFLFGICNL